jgi:hypothetical protein
MYYSRNSPSPRYTELLHKYNILHAEGDTVNKIAAEKTFDGRSLKPHVSELLSIIRGSEAKSVLDYGCGKANGHDKFEMTMPNGGILRGLKEIWGVSEIGLYDPGYAPHNTLPTKTYDGAICTDVLEHCPEEDIDWILSEIFGFADKFVFCTIALYPASKTFSDGVNVHITLKNIGWWLDKFEFISKKFNNKKYFIVGMRTPQNMLFIQS